MSSALCTWYFRACGPISTTTVPHRRRFWRAEVANWEHRPHRLTYPRRGGFVFTASGFDPAIVCSVAKERGEKMEEFWLWEVNRRVTQAS